jgi:hypothetical protein
MTEPPAYERVKSALHEKFELEQRLKDIEEIIEERKSVYFNSRPTSRATSRPASIYSGAQGDHLPSLVVFIKLTIPRTHAPSTKAILYPRTSTTYRPIICYKSDFTPGRPASKDSSVKDSSHSYTPKVIQRSLGSIYHTFPIRVWLVTPNLTFTYRSLSTLCPPSTSSSTCPSITTPSPQKEEILFPRLKLAVPLCFI